jgi:hypothetical protein
MGTNRFEKGLCLYMRRCVKAGDLGLLGVIVPEAWAVRNGICINYVELITFLVQQVLSQLLWSTYRNQYYAYNFICTEAQKQKYVT